MNLDRNVFVSHLRVIITKIVVYSLIILGFFFFVKPDHSLLSKFSLGVFILGELIFFLTPYWEILANFFKKEIKENLTEAFISIGVVCWFFVFWNTPPQRDELALKLIENYLSLLIGVLALGVPFFLDIISRIRKEWHGEIARAYAYSKTNKCFAGYLILSLVASFSLLFLLEKSPISETKNVPEFFLFNRVLLLEIILSISVLASFFAKSFKDYSATEGSIIKYYTKHLKAILIKNSRRVPYRSPIPTFLQIEKPIGKLKSFCFSILNRFHVFTYFVDGKSKFYKFQSLVTGKKKYFISDEVLEKLFPQLKTLYRVANNKLASEQFDSLDQSIISLLEINEFYVSRRGFTTDHSDKYFSEVMIPETKQLFDKALKTNYSDGLEKIVHFVGNTALILLKNISDDEFHHYQAIPTSGLEDLLKSFCVESFYKKDSPATSICIDYLKQITLVYAQKGEFINKASSSSRNLTYLSKYFSELPLKLTEYYMILWAQTKSLQSIKSNIEILSLSLKTGTACKDHYWKQFAEDVLQSFKENLIKLHKSSMEAGVDIGWDSYTPVFDEITRMILKVENENIENGDVFNDEQRDRFYALFHELLWSLLNISEATNNVKKEGKSGSLKKEHVQAIMYLFGSTVNVYNKTKKERLKGDMGRTLEDFSKIFGKNILFLDWTSNPDCMDEFSVIIAVAIIFYDKDKVFQTLLKKSIENTIEYFNSLDEKNDQFEQRRRHIYKRLLLYGVWLKKLISQKGGVYKTIHDFLIKNTKFIERHSVLGGWCPFPESDSNEFGHEIWKLKSKSHYLQKFDKSFSQKVKSFDDTMEEKFYYEFLKTIENK